MLATGAAFAAIERKEQASDSFEVSNNQLTIKSKHYAYWTMLGVGIAATVAGAVMAGLGGYYYTHPISEDLAIQMDVGVSNISFGLTF